MQSLYISFFDEALIRENTVDNESLNFFFFCFLKLYFFRHLIDVVILFSTWFFAFKEVKSIVGE